jgi:hypothetical protein
MRRNHLLVERRLSIPCHLSTSLQIWQFGAVLDPLLVDLLRQLRFVSTALIC